MTRAQAATSVRLARRPWRAPTWLLFLVVPSAYLAGALAGWWWR